MKAPQPLNLDDFKNIVRLVPLVSLDVLILTPASDLLLLLRENEPAKNCWFVPGGCVYKNEPLQDAFARIANVELGRELSFNSAHLLGVFDHFYSTNRFSDPSFGTHYVSIAYWVTVEKPFPPRMDDQHDHFRWIHTKTLLSSLDCHPHIRQFIEKLPASPGP